MISKQKYIFIHFFYQFVCVNVMLSRIGLMFWENNWKKSMGVLFSYKTKLTYVQILIRELVLIEEKAWKALKKLIKPFLE